MIVKQILAGKSLSGIVTVKPEASVTEVVRVLGEKRIGAVIVSRDGKALDGIVSERDVVRALAVRGLACLTEPVTSIMTARVTACRMGDTVEDILGHMTDGRFRHMPVMVDGVLAGIISIGDVVKARLDEMGMEKHALEDMIRGF